METLREEYGISVWKAPYVKPGETFFYYDPIHKLDPKIQERWNSEEERQKMINEVTEEANKA